MRGLINSMIALTTIGYPLVMFWGSNRVQPWQMATLLSILLLIRLAASYSRKHWTTPLLMVSIVYCVFVVWHNQLGALRLYPVLVNTLMLIVFAWSLYAPPTVIERLARLQHPDLPSSGVRYTRRVTQIWCGFFMLNGSIALITALWGSLKIWSLYNGLIAYVLMGLLFAVEYIVRLRTQKHGH